MTTTEIRTHLDSLAEERAAALAWGADSIPAYLVDGGVHRERRRGAHDGEHPLDGRARGHHEVQSQLARAELAAHRVEQVDPGAVEVGHGDEVDDQPQL